MSELLLKDLGVGNWFTAYGFTLMKTKKVGIGYTIVCIDENFEEYRLKENVKVKTVNPPVMIKARGNGKTKLMNKMKEYL